MIFTVGNTRTYEELLDGEEPLMKTGKRFGYEGGTVFKSAEDALAYLEHEKLNSYRVYGVNASWKHHTYRDDETGLSYLRVDAQIVRLKEVLEITRGEEDNNSRPSSERDISYS